MLSRRRARNLILSPAPVLIMAVAVFLLSLAARAATVTGYSDLLTRLAVSTAADHEIRFVTPTGVDAPGDTIVLTFESDFNVSSIAFGDVDLAVDSDGTPGDCSGTFAEKTLAASAAAGTWGVGVSGQALTLTSPTNAGVGEIAAGACARVRIGTNATFDATGDSQIVNPSTATAHTVILSGSFGDTGTAYVFIADDDRITITAVVGNGGGGGGGPGGGGPAAPVINNVRTLNVTETEADVLWETDVQSSSTVNYGLTNAYGSNASTGGNTYTHNVHLSGLTPGTTYHYRARSLGVGTPEAVSGDFTFTTLDTSAPVISNVAATNVTGTTARITWDTDEDADSKTEYGTTVAYGSEVTSGAIVNVHRLDVAGLTPNTTYHFRVTSKDAANNSAVSGDFTFVTSDTIPPAISNVSVDALTPSSARVNWSTDELADSTVRYGLTSAYGSTTTNDALVANHQLTLGGLAAGTLYHFSVSSTDVFGNGATSTDQTFTTLPDATPPANVSGLTVTPGNHQNSLAWTNPADVDFAGVKVQRSTTGFPATPVSGTSVYEGTNTSFLDLGLNNGTPYYYTVFAYDNSGNFASGSVGNGTPFDLVPPAAVTSATVTPGDAQNALTWTNPVDADFSNVRIQRSTTGFPATPGDGTMIYSGDAQSTLDAGLVNGTTYYYSIFARDTSGNYSNAVQVSGTPNGAPPPGPVCGNTACEASETAASCPADCAIPPSAPFCGNAVCEASEDNSSCPIDCPQPPQPPVTPPTPTTTQPVNRSLVRAFAMNRTLELHQSGSGAYRILPERSLTIFVPLAALPRPVTSMVLSFNSGSYLFQRTAASDPREGYAVDVSAPSMRGLARANIIITFDDATSDVVPVDILVEPFGRVLSAHEGQQLPVPEAAITVHKRIGGSWIVWDATPYAQSNPTATPADGSFAFMAPQGEYQLTVQKDGFRTYEGAPITLSTEVINPSIDLIALPPSLIDAFVPGATVTENIGNIARAFGAQGAYITKIVNNEVIEDPRVKSAATTVLVPTAATITTVIVATAVQATSLISYFYLLLTQPLLLIGRRKRKEYGVIYNSLTKMPVDLAIVRLYRTTNGKLVRTTVTDKQGRYAFLVEPGLYRIEVSKGGFTFPTRYLKGRQEDAQYLDLYHGEAISVGQDGAIIVANIPLDPPDVVKSNRRLFWEEIGRRIQNSVALSSVLLTVMATILYRQPYLFIVAGSQIVLYLLFRRLARAKRPKNWGIVYDEKTKKPIPFAIARIVETQYNKVLESRVTDSKGRYNFLVGNNRYVVTTEKPGYEATKSTEIDLSQNRKEEGGVVNRDIAMREKSPE